MIKRIELVNFMSHSHTVIEPADGLTVLIGPNNCGKSAVVTALQILAHNANSTYVRRHHEKNCEVIVETDDGHTVKWSRSKNGSPKYEIDGEEFDRLKRGGKPAILDDILRLPKVASDSDEFDIHFGQQKVPVFLLNDSGKAAAQFFASSSDAIRLVEMQALHKTKIRESKRDHKRIQAEAEQLEAEVEVLATTSGFELQLLQCEEEFVEIEKSGIDTAKLENLVAKISEFDRQLQFHEAMENSLTRLAAPPTLEAAETLESLVSQLVELNITSRRTGQIEKILQSVPSLPSLEDELLLERTIIDISISDKSLQIVDRRHNAFQELTDVPQLNDIKPLQSMLDSMQQAQHKIEQTKRSSNRLKEQMDSLAQESKKWAASNPTCPTCGAATDVQQLLQRKKGSGCHG